MSRLLAAFKEPRATRRPENGPRYEVARDGVVFAVTSGFNAAYAAMRLSAARGGWRGLRYRVEGSHCHWIIPAAVGL